jgi:Kdo2-lipid IVA lauroyltransferase/acyltransferase
MIKNLKYLLQSLAIYFFFLLGKLMGLRNSQKFFSYIFKSFGSKFRSNKIIYQNLEIFNPNITLNEKKVISQQMWSNYGKTFIEYIFLDKYKKKEHFTNLEGEHILDDLLRIKKPAIFISGHFANFEMMSMEIIKKKINLATIYRPLNNFFLNPFMEFLRKKYICKDQIRKGRSGVKDAIQYINRGYSIALMIDQRLSEGEAIKFFNQTALTTTLPAQLALKFNLNIIPVFIERENNDNFKIKFYSPIDSTKFKNKFELTKYLNTRLEEMITKNPSQWIWTHNRWKL